MERLLVISSSPIRIGALLGSDWSGRFEVTSTGSATRAKRLFHEEAFDVVLVNSPLPDETAEGEIAALAAEYTDAGILLFVRPQSYESALERYEKYGVAVLPKNCAAAEARAALRMTLATSCRIRKALLRTRELQKKFEELKIVDRAKCVLIQYLGLTEEQAHKQIEREAMDSRRTKAEVAKDIITAYER